MKKVILLVIIGLSYTACTKPAARDSQPPVVSLTSPVNLQSISAGSNLHVRALITDDHEIAAMHVNIEGPDFLHHAYGGAGLSYDLSEYIPISIKGNYSVSVDAYDNAGNHGIAKVDITVN